MDNKCTKCTLTDLSDFFGKIGTICECGLGYQCHVYTGELDEE